MKIDTHSHYLPDTVIEHIRKHGDRFNSEIIKKDGREFVLDKFGGICYPIFEEYYNYGMKAADLDKMGLDMAVLSVVPNAFYYWIEPEAALEISEMCNDWAAAFCSAHADRFSCMATVPMQSPQIALQELRRAHEQLGMRSLEIAPMIEDAQLDDEKFFPLYEYCAANDICIFLHPCFSTGRSELKDYYNINLVGNVYQTNLGINNLIFGGVFEKFPDLKILAAHGGGYFPYQMGRLKHGFDVRTEPHKNIGASPEAYIKNVYFDTITHWTAPLQFLVDQFGSEQVMIGTDYPFDMGDYEPVEHVRALKLTAQERENIFSANALRLFGAV